MRIRAAVVLIFLLVVVRAAGAQLAATPFTVSGPDDAQLDPGQSRVVHILIQVPDRHYLYQEKTAVEFQTLEGLRVKAIDYPPAKKKFDPFVGREIGIFEHDVDIAVTLEAPASLSPGRRELQAYLAYQGCSEKLCFRPEEKTLRWFMQVGAGGAPSIQIPPATSWTTLLHLPDFRGILAHGALLAFCLTFVGGILTAFTPCVLPLLPVVLLIIGIHPGAHRRNFLLALCLTIGLALTYAVIGMIGALVGVPMSYLFQQRWFLFLLVAFYVAMAGGMFGFFAFRLPQGVQQRLHRLGGSGPEGAFLAGVSTGLLATPCAGPVIGALVAYVGTQRDIGLGFALLLTYGLGFGTIFLLLGTCFGSLTQRIRRPIVMRLVKIVLGCLLLLPAGYYGWVLIGNGGWQGNEDAAFRQARATHRPVMIEFTAKSCPPCLVLEQTTLRDPRVMQALGAEVVPLRIDTTFTNAAVTRVIERYKVVGWPTVLLVSPDGAVFEDLTMVGVIPTAEQLLQAIAEARQRMR